LPYTQDWNLNVQRSFGANWLFEIGYVGTKGTKLPRFIEGNPAVFVPGASTEDNVNQRRLHSGCTLADPTAPCNYASVGLIAGIANSSYNAMEVSLRKRFRHGLSFLASYTLSKTIDDVSSFNITGSASQSVAGENDLAQNPFDLLAERGRSMFDARNRLVISYEWNLPLWRHPENWYQQILGNWQAKWHHDVYERNPVHGVRLTGRLVAGGRPRDLGLLQQPAGSGWQSELWAAHAAGMVQT
jgi:hypothetical protein